MKQKISRILSAVLLLTMLMGTLGVFTVVASAADTDTTPGYNVKQVYKSNWIGSTITGQSYGRWVKAEGDYNGKISWVTGLQAYEALDATTGVLSFTGAPASQDISFQFDQAGVANGAAYMSFEVYFEAGTFPGLNLKQNTYDSWHSGFLTIDTDGSLKWFNRDLWASQNTGYTLVEGWNRITVYSIPSYSVDDPSVMSGNQLYLDVNGGEVAGAIATTELSHLPNLKWSPCDAASGHRDFRAGLKINLRMANQGDLQLRNCAMGNLEATELYSVSFDGYSDYNAYVPTTGGQVTLPVVDGFRFWRDQNGNVYDAGTTIDVSGALTLYPATSKDNFDGYSYNYVYTPNWVGSSTGGGGWGYDWVETDKELHWVNGFFKWASGQGVTLDAATGALTFPTASHIDIQLNMKDGGITTGAAMLTFDVYYQEGAFSGFRLRVNGAEIITVDTQGYITYDGAKSSFGMTEGWNTFYLYGLPNYDGNGAQTSMEMYANIGSAERPTSFSYGVTDAELSQMFHYTRPTTSDFASWKTMTLIPSSYTGDDMIIKGMKYVNLTADQALYQMYFNGVPSLAAYAPVSSTEAIKVGAGIWTDGETYYKEGDSVTLSGNMEVDGVKLSGAQMKLGGEMILKFRLKKSVVDDLNATDVCVIADGKLYNGVLEGDYYIFTLAGLRAAEMGKLVDYRLQMTIDGKILTSYGIISYSPLLYAQRIYVKEDNELAKKICTSMVQYGHAAELCATGASNILESFNSATGENLEFSVDAYDPALVRTDVDTSAFAGLAQVGATLTSGVNLVYLVEDESIVRLEMKTVGETKIYEKSDDGAFTITDVHAAMLCNKLELTFVREDGSTIQGTFSVANYLDMVVNSNEANMTEAHKTLAKATAIYMAAVREYALT